MKFFIATMFALLLLFCSGTNQFLPDQIQSLKGKRTSEEALENFFSKRAELHTAVGQNKFMCLGIFMENDLYG